MDFTLVTYKDKGVIKWRKEPAPPGVMRDYLGATLRKVRQSKKLRLRDIDGVSLGYVSEIETGKKEVSSEILEALCDSIGVKMSDVLRETADRLEKVGK